MPGRSSTTSSPCVALALLWLLALLLAPPLARAQLERLPARLLIAEYRVEGNTVLSTALIESALMAHLGPDKTLADIQSARDALAKAYEQGGWQAVSVDAERVDPVDTPDGPGWVAVLRVAEGPVSRLRISGAQYNLPSQLAQTMPSVQEGRPLDFNRFQQDLARVSQLAGVNVTPVLRPGRDPGTMEVELKFKDSLPLAAWAELNNDDSADTSPRRLELGFRYDNLFQAQHGLTARFITSPLNRDEVQVATLSYSLPLASGAAGEDRLSVYAVLSDSNIQANTGTGVIGKGQTLGLRWTRVFPPLDDLRHNLTLGLDIKRLQEDSAATGARPLNYVPLSAQYALVRPDDSGRWSLGSTLNAGLRWLNDRQVDCQGFGPVDQFACKRVGASPDFLRWAFSLQREQRLGDWRLDARAEFQLASEPLIGNEQFYIGGAESVRGYYASEQGGDDGVRAGLEITSPRLTPGDWPLEVNAVGFVDGGWTRRQQPLAGEASQGALAGAGLGLRVRWSRQLSASLDWARTLKPGPRTPEGAHRLHGNLRLDF